MNVKAFKQIIKEAVGEAVREELQAIFEQQSSSPAPMQEIRTAIFDSPKVAAAGADINSVRSVLAQQMGSAFGRPLVVNTPTVPSHNFKEYDSGVEEAGPKGVNPYLNFIQDAAANMTPHEKHALKNLDQ